MPIHAEAFTGLPIWMIGLIITGLAVLSAIVVELGARRTIPLRIRENQNSVAGAMFTVIGTTYAVLLAFVASLAWEGYNKAQSITDAEASLVQNVYQIIGGLTGPEMSSMRQDILSYARVVVSDEWPAQARGEPVDADDTSLAHLTNTALRLHPDNIAAGDLHTLLLVDLDRLASTRRERLFASRTPIPSIVWFVLITGGGITVVFGSLLGAPSVRMHLAMSSLLAISGTLVLLVVVALSSPFRGDYRISAEPFERVLLHMLPG